MRDTNKHDTTNNVSSSNDIDQDEENSIQDSSSLKDESDFTTPVTEQSTRKRHRNLRQRSFKRAKSFLNDSRCTLWRTHEEFSRVRAYSDLSPDEDLKALIDNLKEYINEYKSTVCDPFWRRKSGRTVLAVVMIRLDNRLEFYRGINSEISLPSGSNCAERAAISAAISTHLSIKRENFLAIAGVDPSDHMNPIDPCGVCKEWLTKIQDSSSCFSILSFPSVSLDDIIERYPIAYIEEKITTVPQILGKHWSCKCGFACNNPMIAKCIRCGQNRYKFKQKLALERSKVLQAITKLETRDLQSTSALIKIVEMTDMSSEQVIRTIKDLKSLKFIQDIVVQQDVTSFTPSMKNTTALIASPPSIAKRLTVSNLGKDYLVTAAK